MKTYIVQTNDLGHSAESMWEFSKTHRIHITQINEHGSYRVMCDEYNIMLLKIFVPLVLVKEE